VLGGERRPKDRVNRVVKLRTSLLFGHSFHVYDLQSGGAQEKHNETCFYFGERNHILAAYLGFLCWGVPHVPKNVEGGPIKWLFLKRERKMFGAPPH
jgi:hypothetical protein